MAPGERETSNQNLIRDISGIERNVALLRGSNEENALVDTLDINHIHAESSTHAGSLDNTSLNRSRAALEDLMKDVKIQVIEMKRMIEENRKEMRDMNEVNREETKMLIEENRREIISLNEDSRKEIKIVCGDQSKKN